MPEKTASYYAQQRLIRRRQKNLAAEQPTQLKKKMTGAFFYMMLSLTILKDFFDFLLTFTIILSFFIILINFVIMFVLLIYYFINDIKLTSRKLVTVIVGFTVEMIPIIGLLPMASLSLIMVRKLENSERLSKMANKRVRLAV